MDATRTLDERMADALANASAENTRLHAENTRLRVRLAGAVAVLRHIAYDPIGHAEASAGEILGVIERMANVALEEIKL